MPAPMTEKQRAFVLEYARNGGNASAAAREAGYPIKSAHEQGRQQLEKPHIRKAIYKELMKLRYRSGVIGLSALIAIAKDDTKPSAARVAAARALLEHADLPRKNDPESDLEDQEREEITDYESVLRGFGTLQNSDRLAS